MAESTLVKAAKADVKPIYDVVVRQIEAIGWVRFKDADAIFKMNKVDLIKVARLFEVTGWKVAPGDTLNLYDKPVVQSESVTETTLIIL